MHDDLAPFERPGLERLRLAADALLSEPDAIPDPLEAELILFRERVEGALLLPPREKAATDSGAAAVGGARRLGARLPLAERFEDEMPHPVVARMALEILARELVTSHIGPLEPEQEAVASAIHAMHAMLWDKEMKAVAATNLTANYLVIRPVNPLHMPAPEEADEIGAAIATLTRHGMIARNWEDD